MLQGITQSKDTIADADAPPSAAPTDLNKKQSFGARFKRGLKIATAATLTTTAIVVTGGFAVPLIAAAGSTLITTLGVLTSSSIIISTTTFLSTLLVTIGGNATLVGVFLGVTGGKISSNKWRAVMKEEAEVEIEVRQDKERYDSKNIVPHILITDNLRLVASPLATHHRRGGTLPVLPVMRIIARGKIPLLRVLFVPSAVTIHSITSVARIMIRRRSSPHPHPHKQMPPAP